MDDTNKLKFLFSNISTKILKTGSRFPTTLKNHRLLKFKLDPKDLRGFCNIDTGDLLCPLRLRDQFNEDPMYVTVTLCMCANTFYSSGFMDQVQDGKFEITSDDLPSFLYETGTVYDPENENDGLFRGFLIVRVSTRLSILLLRPQFFFLGLSAYIHRSRFVSRRLVRRRLVRRRIVVRRLVVRRLIVRRLIVRRKLVPRSSNVARRKIDGRRKVIRRVVERRSSAMKWTWRSSVRLTERGRSIRRRYEDLQYRFLQTLAQLKLKSSNKYYSRFQKGWHCGHVVRN